ncbi:rhamnogalacturonate lyase family protein [Actinidia rufa]|uniref:Rhamnogalacturonate lyase family protein n=1 Tax=Actinidia rufa TaxID=165716 RepID=A0A7J0EN11_9ERIC|nr:rhamnogalacturonate lyase family protein [Actinidia rufa]
MAISDTRQRIMPTPNDRSTGQPLDYHEAVLLTNPSNQYFKGEVDDKYQYSADIKDNRVHGWISCDRGVGFWVITPSNEFRIGGPLKQELTSHVGPTSLSVFISNHYAGILSLEFEEGEPWKKVFGPIFIYLNSAPSDEDPKYINKDLIYASASSAYVGLALPESQDQIMANRKQGNEIKLGNLVYDPLRIGPTIWEIGFADRTAAGFYVPDPYPDRINHLYIDHPDKYYALFFTKNTKLITSIPSRVALFTIIIFDQRFRQYGLWNRYSDLYSDRDLIYTVGNSTYQKDWFFAHVTRKTVNGTYVPTTWTILFDLDDVRSGTYTLQLALASTSYAALQVRINDPLRARPHFTTMLVGRDNAIARHGIHGLYSLYSVEVSSVQLFKGRNAIYLTQSRGEVLSADSCTTTSD